MNDNRYKIKIAKIRTNEFDLLKLKEMASVHLLSFFFGSTLNNIIFMIRASVLFCLFLMASGKIYRALKIKK
jgi:hypothetical protein